MHNAYMPIHMYVYVYRVRVCQRTDTSGTIAQGTGSDRCLSGSCGSQNTFFLCNLPGTV